MNDDITKHIRRIQRKFQENVPPEKKVKYLQYLASVPVSLELLKETSIGKSVNLLRKERGIVGELAGKLVLRWKDIATSEYSVTSKNKSCDASKSKSSPDGFDPTENKSSRDTRDVTIQKSVRDSEAKQNKLNGTLDLKKQILQDVNGISNSPNHLQYKPHDATRCDIKKEPISNELKPHRTEEARRSSLNELHNGIPPNHKSKQNVSFRSETSKQAVSARSEESDESFSLDTIPVWNCDDENEIISRKTDKMGAHTKTDKMGAHTKIDKMGTQLKANKMGAHTKTDKMGAHVKTDKMRSHIKTEKEKEKPLDTNDNVKKKQVPSFEDMMMMPISHVKKKKKRATPSPKKEPDAVSQKNMPTLPDIELPQVPLYNAEPVYRPNRPALLPEIPKNKTAPVSSPTLDFAEIKSRRKTKSVMYTGKKTTVTVVLSLHQLCMRVLINNVDSLYETGGVPFSVLVPLLSKCPPAQLERLEYYNPHFIEDTDGLWKIHCQRDFRGHIKDPDSVAAWRDLYKDLSIEREEKLHRLSTKISANQAAKIPERSVKLAYVATTPKGSAFIQRKQKRFGTGVRTEDDEDSKKEEDHQKEIRDRIAKEQSEVAEPVPFTNVPRRDRCAKRPPSSLSISGREPDTEPRKKHKEELGSVAPPELTPTPRKRKAKKPMMLKAMQLLKKQKGRMCASIMRK